MPHTQTVSSSLPTVVETSVFSRRAEKLLTPDEYADLILLLALRPLARAEIPGTGGVRKLRFAAQGHGKSGGVRVIYYFFDETNPVYALFLYGKNEQVDLTAAQKSVMTKLAASIKAEARIRRRS